MAPGQLRPTDVIGAFFLCGVAFALAGAAVAVADAVGPWAWGRWLALHLLFVGGISQLILGASQFFAGAFLATDPPRRALVRAQLACWNVGAVLVAAGVPNGSEGATALGAGLLLAALAFYAAAFASMSRRALNSAPWAARWYLMAAAFLVPGLVAGVAMANGYPWAHGNLLGAHMALNLAGWFGAAIVGTLHTFYPSLTRTQLRFPRLQGPAFLAWAGGVCGLALGYGFAVTGPAIAGWALLAVAACLLLGNVLGSVAAAATPLSLPARLVGLGQAFLLAAVVVALAAALDAGPEHALAGSTRAVVAVLLVGGWIGLTVAGSLLHLLALLTRVRDLRRGLPVAHPARDRAITLAAAVAIGGCAAAQVLGDWTSVGRVLLVCLYAGLGARVAQLAVVAATRARPRF